MYQLYFNSMSAEYSPNSRLAILDLHHHPPGHIYRNILNHKVKPSESLEYIRSTAVKKGS